MVIGGAKDTHHGLIILQLLPSFKQLATWANTAVYHLNTDHVRPIHESHLCITSGYDYNQVSLFNTSNEVVH